jgi:hypothetical protein
MNSMPKHVASRTLETATLNATIIINTYHLAASTPE